MRRSPASSITARCTPRSCRTSRAVARSAACPWPGGRKGRRRGCRRGSSSRVQLAPFRVEQAGIQTAEVGFAPLMETLTTVGYVGFDERKLATIASKVTGKSRVEKLHVNFTGREVKAGEPLAELYSPELRQAIQELLITARRAEQDANQSRSAAARVAAGRSPRAGPALRREAQAVGDHPGSDRRDPRAGEERLRRSRSSRRSAAPSSRRTWSRGRRCRKATRCSRSPT